VAHKLPEGVKTKFFEELEKGNILIMPQNAKELEEMLQLVLYNPTPYIYHRRLMDALVKIQQINYDCMKESKFVAQTNSFFSVVQVAILSCL